MSISRLMHGLLVLTLVAACGGSEPASVDIDAARITEPITGRTVSLGGFQIAANGEDAQLISVTSQAAKRIELHTMLNEDGVMKMRRLKGGLTISAGETLTLGSGGPHLMVFGLGDGLVPGDVVELEVTYAQGGDTETVSVQSVIQTLGQETDTP